MQWGYQVKPAFFSQESQQNVAYGRTVWQEVRDVDSPASDLEMRNLLGAFLFSGDDIHKPVSVLSGGEKSRLALVKILLRDSNCLILDEPTNHLDVKTKDIFQNALLHYSGTIILVSHDRYFLDHLVRRVFEIRDGQLHEYTGNYSYFIQKRDAERAAPPSSNGAKQPPRTQAGPDAAAGAPGAKKPGKSRELRRQEAEERNQRGQDQEGDHHGNSTRWRRRSWNWKSVKARNRALLCDPEVLKESLRIKPLMQELKQVGTQLERVVAALGNVDAAGRSRRQEDAM